jgi:hypothetical protein
MVAVGFNPRFTAFHEGSRRGATPETTFVVLWHTPTSSVATRRGIGSRPAPWVETHGYHRAVAMRRGESRRRSSVAWRRLMVAGRFNARSAAMRFPASRSDSVNWWRGESWIVFRRQLPAWSVTMLSLEATNAKISNQWTYRLKSG